ncbi:DUF4012 domain-containing protein [Candidatus Dojkabacteria bacterium]|nr:DUF4012 domain-containing protein [Candidatus Dojkabacteria bacterium]
MRNEANKLKSTSKYPTSIIVKGVDTIGVELAGSLIEQGGYVIMIDTYNEESFGKIKHLLEKDLFTFVDFSALSHLEDDLRRLDYVFFLGHQETDIENEISTQEFLEVSNYLNAILDLSTKFEAKFLLTNSIRAHRRLIGEQDVHLNFDLEKTKKHTVYSEVEIQRYAESLVMEYYEKVSLNVRILRMGEVIGEAVEFKEKTPLGKLIFDAISGNDLEITGDGLDEEYYVHYLDAVYGLLKGEFTPNTKGKIFSLANQEPVTTLSLAYKVQELEPKAGEIKFVEKKGPLSLKLYKPAENLAVIGWRPKVSFDRALSQSIEQAYNHFSIESSSQVEDVRDEKKNDVLSKKLKNFFFISDNNGEKEDTYKPKGEGYGALSRLIAERKSQEMGRKGSIVLANDKLREKVKGQNQKPAIQRLGTKANKFYDRIKVQFNFLTRLTLSEFALYLFLVMILAVVYFGVVSPLLSLGKDVYFGNRNLEEAKNRFISNDIIGARESAKSSLNNFDAAEKTLNRFEAFFNLVSQKEVFISGTTLLRGAKMYSEGLEQSFSAVSPAYEYFEKFEDNVYYRPNDGNLLVSESSADYSEYLQKMSGMEIVADDGISKIVSATALMSTARKNYLPKTVIEKINSIVNNIDETEAELQSAKKTIRYLPDLLGGDGPKSYIIILQDNSRYNPSGGKINSYAFLTFEKGGLKSIKVENASSLNLSFDRLNPKTLDQINLISFQNLKVEDVTLSDFQLINDFDLFSSEIIPYLENYFERDIDGAIFLNINSLEKLIELYGGIEVEQIEFDGKNLLMNVDLVLRDNREENRRTEIITQVFALVLQKIFTSTGEKTLELASLSNVQLEVKDMMLQFEGEYYQEQIETNNWNGRFNNNSDFIKIAVVSKAREFSQTKYPNLNIDINDRLKSDLTTVKQVTIEPKSLEDLDYVTVCLPAGATELNFGEINPLLYNQNFSAGNECVSIKFGQISRAVISYKTPAFESVRGNSYNYNVSIQNTPGLNLIYDYELEFDPGLYPLEYDDRGFLQRDKLIYAGTLDGNLILNLKFGR